MLFGYAFCIQLIAEAQGEVLGFRSSEVDPKAEPNTVCRITR
jgi:hypothetical protein